MGKDKQKRISNGVKFKKHKLVSRFPYLATIFGLLLFLPNKVLAVDPFVRLIGDAIWSFFVYPMIWALQLELGLLKLVARYNNFTNEGGVVLGWIALRDLSNMFFILILLVIAFATILRISSYGYQQLLKRTLIIAILINFSKSIVGFVIDIAQIVMLTFISAVDDILTGGVVVAIGLQKFTTINVLGDGIGYGDYITSLVMGALLVAILLVVIGIMLMMLTMRIIALWVAIILAPLAFVASIFPATKSFYNTWIKQLGSNLVSGPMLAFFLWLTFSIVGNGEAYKSFMEGGANPGDGATTFLGTTNLVNYIVAISLLLTGIKVAASSGAAGASFASKGMGLMQKTAGKLYRRYPKALAQRTAAGIANRFVDKEGKIKDTRMGKVLQGFSKVPFYGGRAHRGLMGIQGRNAARIKEEQEEETKYINPRKRQEYYRTQSAMPEQLKDLKIIGPLLGKKLGGSRGLGKFVQAATSFGGGHFDAEIKKAAVMVDRNEINNQDEADFAGKHLEKIGDQARLDKLHKQWANTYDSARDVDRDLNENDFSSIMRGQKSEAAIDKDGKVTRGARLLIEGAFSDKDTVGYDIMKSILAKDKKGRGAWNKALKQVAEENSGILELTDENIKNHGLVVDTKENSETGVGEVHFNEKGEMQMNTSHAMVKAENGLLTYPQDAVNIHNANAKQMHELFESGKIGFGDDAIRNLKKRSNESDEDFGIRKKRAEEAWVENDKLKGNINGDKIKAAEFYTKRRQIMGMYTDAEAATESAPALGRIKKAKEELKDKKITPAQYDEQTADDRKFVRGLYESPLLHLDKNHTKIAALVGANVKSAPIRDVAKTEEVKDEDVEKLAKEKVQEERKFRAGQVDEAGKKLPDFTNDELKELHEQKKEDARKELEDKAEKNRVKQQQEFDATYDQKLNKYTIETDGLEKVMEDGLAKIATDKEAQRLSSIGADIAKAITDKDEGKHKALLVEQKSLERIQNKKRRDTLGLRTSNTRNYIDRAILKDATDGFDYSRLQEMAIHEAPNQDLFQELAKVANQQQQRHILEAGNPDQIKLFAEQLVTTGQKLNKQIMDNLPPDLKDKFTKDMLFMKHMREGMSEIQARQKVDSTNIKDLKL